MGSSAPLRCTISRVQHHLARSPSGELDDQVVQRSGGCATAVLSPRTAVVLLGDQLAVPAQDRVRRHDTGELFQRASADRSALRREPPPLAVGEAQATSTELLAKDTVLLLEVLDDVDLAAFTQPANTRSKNWSGATDIVDDSTAPRLKLSRLHAIRKGDRSTGVLADPVWHRTGSARECDRHECTQTLNCR
jgi:hypothetical protein